MLDRKQVEKVRYYLEMVINSQDIMKDFYKNEIFSL
jgi:hypothetical protein